MTVKSDGKPDSHRGLPVGLTRQNPTHTPRFFPGEVVSDRPTSTVRRFLASWRFLSSSTPYMDGAPPHQPPIEIKPQSMPRGGPVGFEEHLRRLGLPFASDRARGPAILNTPGTVAEALEALELTDPPAPPPSPSLLVVANGAIRSALLPQQAQDLASVVPRPASWPHHAAGRGAGYPRRRKSSGGRSADRSPASGTGVVC